MRKGYSYLLNYLLTIGFVFFTDLSYSGSIVVPNHNFYLSICEMVFKPASSTLQISIRFFTDDLEKAILRFDGTKIITKSDHKSENSDQSLFHYLKDNFSVYKDENRRLDYRFIGWEIDKGVVWCYLEADLSHFNKLKVKSELLTELYSSQKNLIYLKAGKSETSVLLDKDKVSDFLRLNSNN